MFGTELFVHYYSKNHRNALKAGLVSLPTTAAILSILHASDPLACIDAIAIAETDAVLLQYMYRKC